MSLESSKKTGNHTYEITYDRGVTSVQLRSYGNLTPRHRDKQATTKDSHDHYPERMDAIEAKAQRALAFIGTTNKVVSNAAKDIHEKVNVNISSRKMLQDKRTEVPLDPKHNCVVSEKEMLKHKRILCNAYTSATLIHTTPNETGDAP